MFHISTVLYNYARRLRLEKLLYLGLSKSPNGFFNHFWNQVAVSLLKPPHGGFRSETAVTKLFRKWNGYNENFTTAMSVSFIQVRPPGYFLNISIIWYNHARRLRLEKLL
jgi:hypothetical protein